MKSYWLLPLCIFIFSACEKVELNELEKQAEQRTVNIRTRSAAGSEINYPLTVYAFELTSGYLVTSSSINNEKESILLNLTSGNYHIVAIAGAKDCTLPQTLTLSSILTLPTNNHLDQPLQMGSTDISVNQDATASIMLYNEVAAIELTLTDVQKNVTEVDVTLSLLNNSIAMAGVLSGEVATTVTLTQQDDGTWCAPRFYTLPGSSKRLTFSITTTSESGKQTYGYNHNTTLKANTPYVITGSFQSGFAVNGSIALAGWNAPQEISFQFGNNTSDENEKVSDELDEYKVNSIPTAGTLWNNHLVGAVLDATTTSAELLLLSTSEWTEITSAAHSDSPDMAQRIQSNYTEDDITNWKIPTREEAKLLRAAIALDKLTATNDVLAANNLSTLSTGETENGDKIRYLCDDATYSYSWDNTTTSKAGAKRTYFLRLVKRIKVSK